MRMLDNKKKPSSHCVDCDITIRNGVDSELVKERPENIAFTLVISKITEVIKIS